MRAPDGHSWRSGADEYFVPAYVNGSMQGIGCAMPLAPVSPVFATGSVQVRHHDIEVNPNGMLPDLHDQRLALEQEIANLKEKLTHEIKLREALKGGLQRSPGNLPKIPGYVPAKMRELLFEVAVLEEEVLFLEKHAVSLRQKLQDEVKPESSSSMILAGGDETVSAPKKPIALDIEIPEAELSEPTTPNVPVTPLLTPFVTPEWRPSAMSSLVCDGNMLMSSPVPPGFALPVSMTSSPPHGEESDSVPPPEVLNRKRVIRRGSSSSESLPADISDSKSSRKKPNHKKSQSLPCVGKKTDAEYDTSCVKPAPARREAMRDVYERLSAPKNGGHARSLVSPPASADFAKPKNAALRRSASVKEVRNKCLSRTPRLSDALLSEKGNSYVKRSTRKEHSGRSPTFSSSQLETKAIPYLRCSSSNGEAETQCALASSPSPVFEDNEIASIKRIVLHMSLAGASQPKFQNCSNSLLISSEEQGNQDRLVMPFKLPPTGEKENHKMTLSDERRRTHDLVITRSLPSIKLNMVSNKTPTLFEGEPVRHRLCGRNNFSENAKLYAKAKLSTSLTKQGFKVRPVQVQKASAKVVDSEEYSSRVEKKFEPSQRRPESDTIDYDDKDDKVDKVACGPIADAFWLSDDLARLFGAVCSKIRRYSSSPDPATNKMLAKPSIPLLGGSQRVPSFGRSQSFDIRSQGGLQLLEEYCSDEMDLLDSYELSKHRTANAGPHRHYYKAIKPPLELKLKA